MKVCIKTFKCGPGDCIFILLKDRNDIDFSIMTDCCKYTREIKNFIENNLQKHINVLIVTHIDSDHTQGVIEMLQQTRNLTINKILFNCYQYERNDEPIAQESADQKKQFDNLLSELPRQFIRDNGKIDAKQASLLTSLIVHNPQWYAAWRKNSLKCGDTLFVDSDHKWGKIIILSPSIETLSGLKKVFRKQYLDLFKEKIKNLSTDVQCSYFELVGRIGQLIINANSPQPIASTRRKNTLQTFEEAMKAETNLGDLRIANQASLAYIWEKNGHRILILGDANPETVTDSIIAQYGNDSITFDLVKISHHGSKHSTSKRLMEHICCNNFLITGGNNTDRPSLEAIAKICGYSKSNNETKHIIFNRRNQLLTTLASNACRDIRDKYHFDVQENVDYEFEC